MLASKSMVREAVAVVLRGLRLKAGLTQRELAEKMSRSAWLIPVVDRVTRAVLLEARRDAGLTQRQLAARCKRPHSWIAKIELGHRKFFIYDLLQIAESLGIPPEKLAGRIVQRFEALQLESKRTRSPRRKRKGRSRSQSAWLGLLASYHIHSGS